MQYSQEHLKTMVYAEFGGQTECIMGNWKIENGPHYYARGRYISGHVVRESFHRNALTLKAWEDAVQGLGKAWATSTPDISETAYIFKQIDLPSTRNQWLRTRNCILLKPLSRADQDHVHANPDKK